jgi:DNA modification methylase
MTIIRKEVIGNQTLILGDCLDVMPTLGRFDAVVTSPPYGQQRDYGAKISDWRALVSGALTSVPAHAHTQMLCNLGLIHREGEVVRYWDGLLADMAEAGWRTFGWYVWDQMSGMAGQGLMQYGDYQLNKPFMDASLAQMNKLTKGASGGNTSGMTGSTNPDNRYGFTSVL